MNVLVSTRGHETHGLVSCRLVKLDEDRVSHAVGFILDIDQLGLNEATVVGNNPHLVVVDGEPKRVLEGQVQHVEHDPRSTVRVENLRSEPG